MAIIEVRVFLQHIFLASREGRYRSHAKLEEQPGKYEQVDCVNPSTPSPMNLEQCALNTFISVELLSRLWLDDWKTWSNQSRLSR